MGAHWVASDVEDDTYGMSVGGAEGSVDDFGPEGLPIAAFRWDRDMAVVVLGYWMTLLAT
jgi:hypothetical protein